MKIPRKSNSDKRRKQTKKARDAKQKEAEEKTASKQQEKEEAIVKQQKEKEEAAAKQQKEEEEATTKKQKEKEGTAAKQQKKEEEAKRHKLEQEAAAAKAAEKREIEEKARSRISKQSEKDGKVIEAPIVARRKAEHERRMQETQNHNKSGGVKWKMEKERKEEIGKGERLRREILSRKKQEREAEKAKQSGGVGPHNPNMTDTNTKKKFAAGAKSSKENTHVDHRGSGKPNLARKTEKRSEKRNGLYLHQNISPEMPDDNSILDCDGSSISSLTKSLHKKKYVPQRIKGLQSKNRYVKRQPATLVSLMNTFSSETGTKSPHADGMSVASSSIISHMSYDSTYEELFLKNKTEPLWSLNDFMCSLKDAFGLEK